MDMDKYIGRLLDNRYEILEVIGVGGMAVVYKARCHRLNRLVAIKILKDDYFQDEEFRRRFHAESQAVAMLSHPNIVSVYDVSTSDDADYIVMELIDGITLKQYMEKKGVLNWKETLHFAIQIGKALDHAHSRGIVHRDIKPHNVMVLKNGSVKVADFGIARVMSKSNTLTKEALGSVHYISPEQAKGGRVDSRSDIYSLGVVMYEMMTGRPPYDGESPVAVAIQHINGGVAMPSTLNPNMPGGLEQIIMKAMAKNPADRYPTTSHLLTDMDEFRKNPAMLFDYNNPNADFDAAAKLSNMPRKMEETMPLPQNVAQKVAAKTPAPKPQPPKPAAKPVRRHMQEVIEEEEEQGSKVATIAIVACAVVAVVAVVIFVIAMINGDFDSQKELVEVPNLLGKTQSELNLTDVVVQLGDKRYNANYEKDRIYDQNPKAGIKIAKGGIITIYVSLGPEPATRVMEDLTNLEEKAAKEFLTGTLDVKPENIVVHTEASATIEAGRVTKTKPIKDEELKENQVVEIWISTGKATKIVKIPDVYGKTAKTAEALLNANGFMNVVLEEVHSNKTKGTVINQSEPALSDVDVTTQIVLQISLGPDTGETTVPSEPTEPPIPTVDPDLVSKVITVELPEDMTETYVLSIWQGGEMLQERSIPVGTIRTQFSVTGKDVMSFVVKINGSDNNSWTIEVDFHE